MNTSQARLHSPADQGSAAKPDNRVSVMSLESGRVIKNVTVGKGAHGIVVTRDGDAAYRHEHL